MGEKAKVCFARDCGSSASAARTSRKWYATATTSNELPTRHDAGRHGHGNGDAPWYPKRRREEAFRLEAKEQRLVGLASLDGWRQRQTAQEEVSSCSNFFSLTSTYRLALSSLCLIYHI